MIEKEGNDKGGACRWKYNRSRKIGGIKIRFGNRTSSTDAFVLPRNTEPLLGCIPLEGMDLIVISLENKLEYNYKKYEGGLHHLKGFYAISYFWNFLII
jgi:hypothetical protein